MHTDGDQQTVQEAVDTGANSTQTQDSFANAYQEAIDNGPYKVQGNASDQGNDHRHNRHKATTGKEAQEVRHIDLIELVIRPSGDQTAENADELVVNLAESSRNLGSVNTHNGSDNANAQHGLNSQPGNDSSQSGSTFLILGHADSNTQGKQDSHVINQNAASLNQQQSQQAIGAPAGGVDPVTNTHEQAADRQASHGEHQGFT